MSLLFTLHLIFNSDCKQITYWKILDENSNILAGKSTLTVCSVTVYSMNTGPDFGGLCWICHFGNHFAFSSFAAGEPWESTEHQSVQNRLFGLIVWKVKVSIGKDSFSNLFLKLRNRIPASKCLWNRYYLLIKWNPRNYSGVFRNSNRWVLIAILLVNLSILHPSKGNVILGSSKSMGAIAPIAPL